MSASTHRSLRNLTCRFVDPALEACFREHSDRDWRRRSMVAFSIVPLFYLAMAAFELSAPTSAGVSWVLLASQAVLPTAGLIGFLLLWKTRGARLYDVIVITATYLAVASFVVVAALNQASLLTDSLTGALFILAIYLLAVTRIEASFVVGTGLAVALCVLGYRYRQAVGTEAAFISLQLLFANVLGLVAAMQWHRAERQNFLAELALRNVNEQLLAQLEQLRRAEAEASRRSRLNDLIVRLSNHFVGLSLDELDGAIATALREIGEFESVDRSYAFEWNAATGVMRCSHEWCGPDIKPEIDNLQHLTRNDSPWLVRQLEADQVVQVPSVASLPDEAAAEKEILSSQDIRSMIAVPMRCAGKFTGFVGLDSVGEERAWASETVALLRIFADTLASALSRLGAEREAEERSTDLRDLNRQLQVSNESLQRFAFVASHDLQEPLRAISSYSTLLQRRYTATLDSEGRELFDFLSMGAKRMHDMVGGLLEFSLLDQREVLLEPVDLKDCVARASANLEFSIRERRAHIEVGPMLAVQGDRGSVVHLLQNLISNGIKFTGETSPRLRIEAFAGENEVVVTVHDNGIGVPKNQRSSVFDLFKRLHPSDRYAGNGIGLALCKQIVAQHGGRIWLSESALGGTAVSFTLRPASGRLSSATATRHPGELAALKVH